VSRDGLGNEGQHTTSKLVGGDLLLRHVVPPLDRGAMRLRRVNADTVASRRSVWVHCTSKAGLQHRVAVGAFILAHASLHKWPAVRIEAHSRPTLHTCAQATCTTSRVRDPTASPGLLSTADPQINRLRTAARHRRRAEASRTTSERPDSHASLKPSNGRK
jgi:hypothetical protein